MSTSIQIPRQTDREVIRAMDRIRASLSSIHAFKIQVQIPHHRGNLVLPEENPESYDPIQYAIKEESAVIENFYLITQNPEQAIFSVNRNWKSATDEAKIEDAMTNRPTIGAVADNAAQIRVILLSLIRKELKAINLEVSLVGGDDGGWNKYRNAQAATLSALEQAAATLMIRTTEQNAELDKARSARFEKLESDLRDQLAKERKELLDDVEKKNSALLESQKKFTEKEAAFNTREARHVSRQMLESQLGQVKNWLEDWRLTEGTTKKRSPIFWSYLVAIGFFGITTAIAVSHNYLVISRADDPSLISWWLWLMMLVKTIFPLAAFTTFVVYFIRWSSAWARQHADEEFHNRTRLIDIGRCCWLFDGVSVSQESVIVIPADVLKVV
jgi:hypothetical protein